MRPDEGKTYALTGGYGQPAISNGNTWAESEVKIPVPTRRRALPTPSIEQLEEWESEGGCEAACAEGCWVEPDGYCEHGKPSWLLKLGFI